MKKIASLVLCVFLLSLSVCALAAPKTTNSDTSIVYEEPYVGKTAESGVVLRASAYAKGRIVDTLRKGIKLTVYAAAYDNDGTLWYEVETTSHKEGFVLADQVSFDETTTSSAYSDYVGGGLFGIGSTYIGNARTGVYHLPTCRVLPKEENRTYFTSKLQAEGSGYRACGICKP